MVLLKVSQTQTNPNKQQLKKKQGKNKNFTGTHLYLQNKGINEIPNDLWKYKSVSVLYLQHNNIENVDKLHHIEDLTHLYLQNNKIHTMKGLEILKKLKKLYLGHNVISGVEGLQHIDGLEELHLEKQKLPPGVTLMFDKDTVAGLADSLRVLVVTGNNLHSVAPLLPLHSLQCLKLGDNQLTEMCELLSALQSWSQLRELILMGNPLCSLLRYRETVIAASYHALDVLDGKQVLAVTRSFLQSLALRQASRQIQPSNATRASAHDQEGSSRHNSLQLAINSQHCARLPDIPPQSEPFFGCLFPAWKSGKSRSGKTQTPEHLLANWPDTIANKTPRRKSCSSASTDLSQHLHISRL